MAINSLSTTFSLPPSLNINEIEARDALALMLDGIPSMKKLFKPNGFPFMKIYGFRNKIKVVAIGQEVINLYLDVLPVILRGLKNRYGRMIMETHSEEIMAERKSRFFTYKANSVILYGSGRANRTSGDTSRAFDKMSKEEIEKVSLDVLHRGILLQCKEFGIDVNFDLPDRVFIINKTACAPVLFAGSKTVQHRPAATFLFNWDVHLTGNWNVGYITSRGHGRLWHDTEASK